MDEEQFHSVVGFGRHVICEFVDKRAAARKGVVGRSPVLTALDEVLLFFLHLRHSVVDCLGAVLFEVSAQTYSNSRQKRLQFFYQLLLNL